MNFLQRGKASLELEKKEKIEAEVRKLSQGKMFSFFLNQGEDALITFVDGELSEDGWLEPPRCYMHTTKMGGKWENFACPQKSIPGSTDICPLCASADRPSLVSFFTVIDHRVYQSSKDPNKSYKDTRKILSAKTTTFDILAKTATALGGLAGGKFQVSRQGEKAAAVGSMFLPLGKTPIEDLKALYQETLTDAKTGKKETKTYFEPADYSKEFVFRTGAELAQMGLGNTNTGGVANPAGQGATKDYSSELG